MMRSFLSRYPALSLVLVFVLAAGCRGTPTVPPTPTPVPLPAIQPTTLTLSGGWQFSTDPSGDGETQGWSGLGFDSSSWTAVTVPHSWNAMPAYSNYSGLAWYRRSFTIPADAAGAHLRLRFEAVFYRASVWLNGQLLGVHEGGYTPFEYDVSSIVQAGAQNTLAVEVDNTRAADRLPADLGAGWTYDWWNYGGITRDVTLEIESRAFIAGQQIVAVPHLTGEDSADSAPATATIALQNTFAEEFTGSVRANVLDDATNQPVLSDPVSAPVRLAAGGSASVPLSVTVPSPKLWHFDHPNLYRWSTTLVAADGRVLDTHEATFGIRSIEFKDGSFRLNGEPVRLSGVDAHMDYPGEGSAGTVTAMAADLSDLKKLNEVFTRPVHYPQAEYILDYADRHGILLIPEVPAWQLTAQQLASAKIQDLEKQQLSEIIAADFNHPSVWAWSIGNEFASNSASGHTFVQEMIATVKSLDPTRPVGFASDKLGSQPQNDATALSDFVEMNEYFGTWHGAKQDLGPALDRVHQTWPDKPVIISEFGFAPTWNTAGGRSAASLDPNAYYFIPDGVAADSDQADAVRRQVIEDQMAVFRSRPFVCGAIFWSYADYRTPAKYQTGLVDAARNKRGSWSVLRNEYSPALLDSASFAPIADGSRTVSVALHTRGPLGADMPAYTLRGYTLHWTVTAPDGSQTFSAGDVSLSVLAPGARWSGEIAWTVPAGEYILTLSIIRPTGFSVIDQSYDAQGNLIT